MEKRIYEGIPTDLVPISPAQLGEILKVTKATVCNWLRENKEITGVKRVERMGNRWILYIDSSIL
jgi:hypothetical protein